MAEENGHDVKHGDMLDPKMLLHVLKAFKRGDFTARLPVEWTGISGKISDELNSIIEMNAEIADEFKRVSHVVGRQGRLSERASVAGASGAWKSTVEETNDLIDDLVRPTKEMARVIGADRKSTRLNSSHSQISYAVFCLKKKNINIIGESTQLT